MTALLAMLVSVILQASPEALFAALAIREGSHVCEIGAGDGALTVAAAGCDAIFLRDVYHHFTAPADMIQSMAASLKPGGRIAVIDFTPPPGSRAPTPADRAKDGMHGIHPDDLSQEMGNAGFELVRSEVGNRWFMLVFARKAER